MITILVIYVLMAVLGICAWYHKFEGQNKYLPIVLGIMIVGLDFLAMKNIDKTKHDPFLLRLMFLGSALLILIPVSMIYGHKFGGMSCIATALIAAGLVLIFLEKRKT